MKTITCSAMGGPCEEAMTAGSPEEMVSIAMKHVEAAHPEMAEQIKAMSEEEQAKWMTEFHAKWDALPEDAA